MYAVSQEKGGDALCPLHQILSAGIQRRLSCHMKKTDNKYELKEATLYSAFRRLEQAGYIRTYWGDETVGARRRYYAITELGRTAYQGYKQEWNEAKEMIDQLLK